jgi:hypothetical protein
MSSDDDQQGSDDATDEPASRERGGADRRSVAIKRAEEIGRTVRFVFGSAAFVVAVYLIADAVVKVMDKPWYVSILIAVFTGPFFPAIVAIVYRNRVKRYTETDHQRVIELEQQSDPERSSSQLKSDGTTSPEDRL